MAQGRREGTKEEYGGEGGEGSRKIVEDKREGEGGREKKNERRRRKDNNRVERVKGNERETVE